MLDAGLAMCQKGVGFYEDADPITDCISDLQHSSDYFCRNADFHEQAVFAVSV